jgi:hypothetical protein
MIIIKYALNKYDRSIIIRTGFNYVGMQAVYVYCEHPNGISENVTSGKFLYQRNDDLFHNNNRTLVLYRNPYLSALLYEEGHSKFTVFQWTMT